MPACLGPAVHAGVARPFAGWRPGWRRATPWRHASWRSARWRPAWRRCAVRGAAVAVGVAGLCVCAAALAGAAQGAAAPGDSGAGSAVRAKVEPDSTVLVADGRSAFSIWVSVQAGPATLAVADTLRRYVREISSVDLPVTRADEPAGRRIVLEVGQSRVPDVDLAALGPDGFRIKTAGGDILLTAGTEYGLQNAVYTFLETYLGCRMYSPTVTVVPRRELIVLPRIEDTQVPPIGFRLQSFRAPAYEAWHKLNSNQSFGLFVHTFATLVPPQKHFAEHPEYFSLLNGHRTPDGQLCLTHPDVFRIVVDELRARMRARPEATFWSVSQNDTYAPCECDACQAIDRVEGSPTGSLLAFVNRVAAEFPDQTISTLAYQYTRAAPRTIKPLPNVNIMLCSIECNRSRPLAEDPSSASFVRDVEDWCALTHNIFLWDYVIQFRNLMSPFPNLRVLKPNIQFFVRHGIPAVFQQGLGELHGEFAELRAYLIAKLLWNPDVDVDAVMDDFLQGFYGPAAPYLRRYIDTMHDALEASGEDLSIYGYPLPSENGYLAVARLDEYGRFFDQAEAAVSDDPALLERVQAARLPLHFALLEQAKVIGAGERGAFLRGDDGLLRKRPEIEGLLTLFVERCRRAGIPRLWEHGTPPDEYLAMTRRFVDESARPHLALGRPVSLAEPASPKYHNGDEAALTDGLRGWDDYHFHWLGFEGTDMEALIDLGSVRTVTSVATDFLQDINSWVFMPLSVACGVSQDGRDYHPVGEVVNTIPAERWGPVIAPFDFSFAPTRARYVKVTARSMKTCPAWHKGSGGLAWIFIDEIRVL